MAEEKKTEGTETKLSFKTADDLTNFLMDLQGQVINMQETIDKLAPVEEEVKEEGAEAGEGAEELTEEEVSEIDQLLQSE